MKFSFKNVQKSILMIFALMLATLSLSATQAAAAPPSNGKTLIGVAVPGSTPAELNAFQATSGKSPAIVMDYSDWAHRPNFPTDFATSVTSRGAQPMITWEPWDNSKGSVNQPAYRLSRITAGAYDAQIRRWATQVRAWNNPLYLRFGHEMNGNWYSWDEGVNGNKAGDYVKAYRHVHDIFKSVGVTNVSWVWSPNVVYNGSTSLKGLYPGDAYVDWTALDGYNWGTTNGHSWQTFASVFNKSIAQVKATSNKPFMIGEVGSAAKGGNKAAWISDMFTQLALRPDIRAFIWFNYNKETDWRIQSQSVVATAFRNGLAAKRYIPGNK